jgi:PAS domain S-box-containing protein
VPARKDKYAGMSRAELIAALRERDAAAGRDEQHRRRSSHQLMVHREELTVQREHLIQAQRALELSADQFKELFDFCPLPYMVLDGNGVVQRINLAGTDLLGVERARIENTPLLLHVQRDDRRAFLDHMRRCRNLEGVVTTELSLQPRRGDPIPVELVSRASLTTVAEVLSYHTTATDLRDRRRLEQERVLAAAERHRLLTEQTMVREASAAKDRFLAVLSHELRTPLTPVMLATSTWKDDASLPDPIRKTLAMISRNVGAQARLIDDLLDMTRITQGKLALQCEPLDVNVVVEDVFDQCRAEMAAARVEGKVVLRARDRHVSGDPLRLRQIVWNLVRNAIRFTGTDGLITVATENVGRGIVRVTVTDTGVGFDAELAARMFEPFNQGPRSAAQGGLGLGLAITKGLVEAHGGKVSAASDGPQRGARFTVELPVAAAELQPSVSAAASANGSGDGAAAPHERLRVLLVEDHEDTAQALAYVLEHEGYVVVVAHSVAQAVDTSERSEIDVIVSDLGLPDGSGIDLMRHVRARRKSTRAIALTGYGRREDLDETTRAGFDRHLTKPVDVRTLIAAIESLRAQA